VDRKEQDPKLERYMTRNEMINAFVESEFESRTFIEPQSKHILVDDHLRRALEACKPELVVKAGLGSGKLLFTIAEKSTLCVCVEPSMAVIESFLARESGNPLLKKIQFINGNFAAFPVDYFKANLVVCIDYFDFILSGAAMEEFKRAMQFEGMFFFAGVVLHDEDVEGLYDEFIRMVNPLHNDYYLAGDFRTFMHLKDYSVITDGTETFPLNLKEYISYWNSRSFTDTKTDETRALSFIDENRELFEKLYGLDGNYSVKELYLTGLYRKNKYKEPTAVI
jgi:SAM-dependent methyltransferase